MDRDRSWPTAVGRAGAFAHQGRRHADARARDLVRDRDAPLPASWRDRRRGDRLHGSRDRVTSLLASIGLPEIVAGIMVLALNAYALMGGADFGGGVWDLVASGPRRVQQRELIARTIGPIWEANHVWLIVVVVMLFTAFPVVFGTMSTVLHIPLALMLVGIVLRGSSFVFRAYGPAGR